ncbi:lipid II:glycine glycyltransferase FemX, partial [Leptodesmis sp.]|uniref:lipid II:glycine glycyltransferase FemX n=1 Tax=Leptodesmis sp. TaxID=3100501 RepID=UPI0040534DF7
HRGESTSAGSPCIPTLRLHIQRGTYSSPNPSIVNLCQTLFAANMAEIGLATWNDRVLAAMLIIYWGDLATYLYGGRSPEQPQVMSSYGLHWAAMQRAKARHCTEYDFYGYTTDPQHSYARFSQFKRQFGGTPNTTIGAHDYFFYNRLADTLITLFKRLHPPPDPPTSPPSHDPSPPAPHCFNCCRTAPGIRNFLAGTILLSTSVSSPGFERGIVCAR